jgi:subtilisin family serine protease
MTDCFYRLWIQPLFLFLLIILPSASFGADGILFPLDGNNEHSNGVPIPRFKAGEMLIKFKSGVSTDAVKAVCTENRASHLRTLQGTRTQVWRVPEGKEEGIAAQLTMQPDVLYAEPNYIYRIFTTPNDPDYTEQWAHQAVIGSSSAWDVSTGSTDIVIAILDSGIDADHPDLSDKIVAGYDFVHGDDIPDDENGHGTHVSGIAAAATNNNTGVAGMDWQARIMPVKVVNYYGWGEAGHVSQGIIWAYQHGALVINLSLGGDEYSQTMQDAVNAAHAAGCLVVAAMGNHRSDNPTSYPAAFDNVFAVAATTRSDIYANYSQYGSHCDIAAPGGQMADISDANGIYSTMPTQTGTYFTGGEFSYSTGYDYLQGTSMATPFVSGLAALIRAVKPAWTPDQVQAAIEDTAVDLGPVGWDEDYGYGRIDADAALTVLADDCFGDSEGDDGDVDGVDLAMWANAHAITLTDSNLSAFCAAFGNTGCTVRGALTAPRSTAD